MCSTAFLTQKSRGAHFFRLVDRRHFLFICCSIPEMCPAFSSSCSDNSDYSYYWILIRSCVHMTKNLECHDLWQILKFSHSVYPKFAFCS